MNKIKAGLFKLKLRTKLVLSYCILCILWILFFIFGSYNQSIRIVESQLSSTAGQILQQAQQNIEYRLNEMRNVSNLIFRNSTLQEVISRGDSPESNRIRQYDDYDILKSFLNSLTSSYNSYKYKIYVSGELLYSNENVTFFSEKDIIDSNWYPAVIEKEGEIVWLGVENSGSSNEIESISAIRVLKDFKWEYGKSIGILKVDLPESDISGLLSGINLSENASVYLLGDNGSILSSWNSAEEAGSIIPGILDTVEISSAQGTFRTGEGSDDSLVIYRGISDPGWKIVAVIPFRELIGDIKKVRDFYLAFFLIISLLSIIIIYIFSEKFTERVINITKQMKNFEKDTVSSSITVKYDDELGLLENKFNEMAVRIRNLLKDVYNSESKKRDAELKALQAQINPHFLYNTLDTINWMAVDQQAFNISSMVSALGRFLRIVLSGGKDVISIESEIEQTKLYLQIQQIRFKDLLEIEYDIDPEVNSYCTVKLILQPVLENSIIHGFNTISGRKVKIIIRGRKQEGRIIFHLIDDGVGFEVDPSVDVFLASGQSDASRVKIGYGLRNIKERMELYFGEAISFHVKSSIGKGTEVTLEWPAINYES